MTTHPGTGRHALTVVAAALIVTVVGATPAAAHARLLSSDPAGGATLTVPPEQVTLTFNEPIEADFAQVQVTDPTGQRVDAGPPTVDGAVAVAPLVPLTQPGTYNVAFRVVSADGHPVEAAFTFDLAAPPPQEPPAEPVPPAPSPEATPEVSPETTPEATPAGQPLDAQQTAATDDDGRPLAGYALAAAAVVAVPVAAYLFARRRGSTTGRADR